VEEKGGLNIFPENDDLLDFSCFFESSFSGTRKIKTTLACAGKLSIKLGRRHRASREKGHHQHTG
jgi:hypothetical protein